MFAADSAAAPADSTVTPLTPVQEKHLLLSAVFLDSLKIDRLRFIKISILQRKIITIITLIIIIIIIIE